MKDFEIIDNGEEIIGKVSEIVKYIKKELGTQLEKVDLFDSSSECDSIECVKNNFDLWLELLNGLYQDIITDYLKEDTMIKITYNPMGAYNYEVLLSEDKVYAVLVEWQDFEDEDCNYSEVLGIYKNKKLAIEKIYSQCKSEIECEMECDIADNILFGNLDIGIESVNELLKKFGYVSFKQQVGNGKTRVILEEKELN